MKVNVYKEARGKGHHSSYHDENAGRKPKKGHLDPNLCKAPFLFKGKGGFYRI
jgi:hypothetical protein